MGGLGGLGDFSEVAFFCLGVLDFGRASATIAIEGEEDDSNLFTREWSLGASLKLTALLKEASKVSGYAAAPLTASFST